MDNNFLLESGNDYKDCPPFTFGNFAGRLENLRISMRQRRSDGDGCGPLRVFDSAKLQKLESYFIVKRRPEMWVLTRGNSNHIVQRQEIIKRLSMLSIRAFNGRCLKCGVDEREYIAALIGLYSFGVILRGFVKSSRLVKNSTKRMNGSRLVRAAYGFEKFSCFINSDLPLRSNRKVVKRGIRVIGQKLAGRMFHRADVAMAIGKLGNARQSLAFVVS